MELNRCYSRNRCMRDSTCHFFDYCVTQEQTQIQYPEYFIPANPEDTDCRQAEGCLFQEDCPFFDTCVALNNESKD